jgi:hypothetical protein
MMDDKEALYRARATIDERNNALDAALARAEKAEAALREAAEDLEREDVNREIARQVAKNIRAALTQEQK